MADMLSDEEFVAKLLACHKPADLEKLEILE